MSVSRYPQITEELLSAYLDNLVSEEERRLIEHAISVEPQIAWQLESLRQTVNMLQSLPALALPRTFTLNQVLLDERAAAEQTRAAQRRIIQTAPVEIPWWQRWLAIWQSGNPYIRNAAAAALLLLVVLVAGNQLFSTQPQRMGANRALTTAAAPAAEVALVLTATEVEQAVAQESAQENALERTTASAVTEAAPLAAEARTMKQEPLPPSEESGSNSAPTVMANLTQAAPQNEGPAPTAAAAVQEFAAAGNGGMATTPADASIASASGAPQGPGADQQPLDIAAASGSFGGSNEMAVTNEQALTMKQGGEISTANAPQTTTDVYAYTAPLTETMAMPAASGDEQVEEQEVVAAGASIAESNSIEATPALTVTLTPTATFTPTMTPTSMLTATATITATLAPTVTPLSQGGTPQVQAMQLFAHAVPAQQSGVSQLLMVITITLSTLWWRSRKTAQTTD